MTRTAPLLSILSSMAGEYDQGGARLNPAPRSGRLDAQETGRRR